LCLGGVDILQHLGQPALHQRMTLAGEVGTTWPDPGSRAERIDPRCHCPASTSGSARSSHHGLRRQRVRFSKGFFVDSMSSSMFATAWSSIPSAPRMQTVCFTSIAQVKLCKAPNHQISSKRTTAGANFCARSKTPGGRLVSPTHFDRRAGPLTISMCAPHSPATARARRVFHVGVLQRQLDQVACGLDRSVLAEDVE